ncbi:hypothetical protein [Chitinasiproducens palmae]|uniref:Uncharacterized protein n=1 Tax=Chitinasiproducens palmae TaxID=1770053 RepID=A0A1H2PJU0_9BURK|nr:hypothetical protein [Chitinasiproducens palmae]SDV46558.1 hypothetical protein SAMN05216551_101433 [Chitinasiproducens palmae]
MLDSVLWAGLLALLALISQTWIANARQAQEQRILAKSMQDVATALSRYGRIEGASLKVGAAEALEVPLARLVKAGLLSESAIKLPPGVRLQTKMRLDEAKGSEHADPTELAMRHSKGMVLAWREGKRDAVWNNKVARMIGATAGVLRAGAFIGTGAQWTEERDAWLSPDELTNDEHVAAVALADAGTGTQVRLHLESLYGSEGQHHVAALGAPWRPVWESDSLKLRVRARGALRYHVSVETVDPTACKSVEIHEDASRSSQTTSIEIPLQRCWLEQRIVARVRARGTGLDVSSADTEPIKVMAGYPQANRYRMIASVGIDSTATSEWSQRNLVAYLRNLDFKAYDGKDHGRFLRDDVYIDFDVRSPDGSASPWQHFRFHVTDTKPGVSPNYDYPRASSLGLSVILRKISLAELTSVRAQARLGEAVVGTSRSFQWQLQPGEIQLISAG